MAGQFPFPWSLFGLWGRQIDAGRAAGDSFDLVREGRMSSNNNDSINLPGGPNGTDQRFQLHPSTSEPGLAVGEPRRSRPSSQNTGHDEDEQSTIPLIACKPDDFDQISLIGKEYADKPSEAQQWLRNFGNLKPGTEVSQNLIARRVETQDSSGSTRTTFRSLLPLLTTWLKQAFARNVAAKKTQRALGVKTQESRELKEAEHLEWLYQYSQDYLSLDHPCLDPDELEPFCACLLDICANTPERSDIGNAITTLYTVFLKWQYPPQILEETLKVLCRARAYFSRLVLPVHLEDCIRLLCQSELRQQALPILYRFADPGSEDDSAKIFTARGALCLLRSLTNVMTTDGEFVMKFEDIVNALRPSAKFRPIKLCIGALALCNDLLSDGERATDTLVQRWDAFLDVIAGCAASFKREPGSIVRSKSRSSTRGKQEETSIDQDPVTVHDEAVKRINETFYQIFSNLPDEKRSLVYDYSMMLPASFTDSQQVVMLQYGQKNHLCRPSRPGSRDEMDRLVKNFIRNDKRSPNVRILAIETVNEILSYWTDFEEKALSSEDQNVDLKEVAETVAQLVETLADQLYSERDLKVLHSLIAILASGAHLKEHAGEVILHLKPAVDIKTLPLEDGGEKWHLRTRGLVQVFLECLSKFPKHVKLAFDSLVEIANFRCLSPKARISAMTLLFQIRCDSDGYIYVQPESESEYIAEALCRTEESADLFNLDITGDHRASLGGTNLAQTAKSTPPLWMYPHLETLKIVPNKDGRKVRARGHDGTSSDEVEELDLGLWLLQVIQCFQNDSDWETYSFIVVHLGAQLANTDLFIGSLYTIVKLRQVLSEQIILASFKEPPTSTALKKSDVAICMFNVLTPLISYATFKSELIQKGFGDDLVRLFLSGVGGTWEGTSKGCIHALSICCLELPASVASAYPAIVDKMSKNMTQSHLTMHILEFLAQVARLPQVHSNFREEEITMIFGICIQFLEKARASTTTPQPLRLSTPSARHSGINFRRPPYRAAMIQDIGLPQYASALAYHTLCFWFLSLKLNIRSKYVSWIVPRLVWKNAKGEETIDEQSQAFVDMMQRSAFSDLGETMPDPNFADVKDGSISSASWIVGMSIITAETAGHTGLTQITKRQASGTTYASYKQQTAELPSHQAPSNTEIGPPEAGAYPIEMLPSHILLQMVGSATPINTFDQPLSLPKEDFVPRALTAFDRIPTVDSHKVGVLFVADLQSTEQEILANTTGSLDYQIFLSGLGYVVSLKPPLRFNPQGLQYNYDGTHTLAWRDRIAEVVYHVTTMMPTNPEDDPQCVAKKAHVGNCHVLVIYNRSGLTWDFDNFKSQLNYVNIVITPATQPSLAEDKDLKPAFFKVQVLTKPDFQKISPAADPKIISAAQLPQFVRMLALNANLFSTAWNVKGSDVEFPSTWRARLQEIKRLRERVTARPSSLSPPATGVSGSSGGVGGGRRTPVPKELGAGAGVGAGPAVGGGGAGAIDPANTDGTLALQLDFSKWTV